jgi:hypothetical protein
MGSRGKKTSCPNNQPMPISGRPSIKSYSKVRHNRSARALAVISRGRNIVSAQSKLEPRSYEGLTRQLILHGMFSHPPLPELTQPKPCALRSLLVARAMETSPTGHGDFALAIVGLSLRALRARHMSVLEHFSRSCQFVSRRFAAPNPKVRPFTPSDPR